MSGHNAFEFGKKGVKWGAIAGMALASLVAVPALGTAAIALVGLHVAVAAAAVAVAAVALGISALKGGILGGLIGGGIGAFTKDKGSDLVDVQAPNGRVISVPAKDLDRAQQQESARFQQMVSESRGGARTR